MESESNSKPYFLWKMGMEIGNNLREGRFREFKSENNLFAAWNELWKDSRLKQEPNGPLFLTIVPEQMRWIPPVYFYSKKLSYDLKKSLPEFDVLGIRSSKKIKFMDILRSHSELLKEFLFTDDEGSLYFLFSEDFAQNDGRTILKTRLEFTEFMTNHR